MNRINRYINLLDKKDKFKKYHLISNNIKEFIIEKKVDNILIINYFMNDINLISLIDDLIKQKINIFVLNFFNNKKNLRINIQKLNDISELNNAINFQYCLNYDLLENQEFKPENLIININNINEKKTLIKNKEIFNLISKINFKNKIAISYDYLMKIESETQSTNLNLDYIITEKKVY